MTQAAPVPGPSPQDRARQGVAEALQQLDGLPDRPLSEHVVLFDGVHRALQDALASLDEA